MVARAKGISKSEEKLLKKIRGYQVYSREQCIQIWQEVKRGERTFQIGPFGGLFQKHEHRQYITEALVEKYRNEHKSKKRREDLEEILGKEEAGTKFEVYEVKPDSLYPTARYFGKYKLHSLLKYTDRSPYHLFVEAGFTDPKSENFDPVLAETPWLRLACVPRRYWKNKNNRIKAIEWLVDKCRRNGKEYPEAKDFQKNRLGGLLILCSKESPYAALVEAGFTNPESKRYDPVLADTPWLIIEKMPSNYWNKRQNRIKSTRLLVKNLKKPVSQIKEDDFITNHLSWLGTYCSNSPFKALEEAGYNLQPWEKERIPRHYFDEKQNRIKAIKWLVSVLDKQIIKIIGTDFIDHNLSGLLQHHYESSPFKALKEAGYDIKETDMHQVSSGYWQNEENFRKEIIAEIKKNNGKLLAAKKIGSRLCRAIFKYYGGINAVREKYEPLAARGS